jgi:uncharacterized protein
MRQSEIFPNFSQAAFILLVNFVLQYLVGAALYDLRKSLGLNEGELDSLTMLIAYGLLIVSILHYQQRTHKNLLHSSPSSIKATFIVVVPLVLLTVPLLYMLDWVLIDFLQRLLPVSVWEERAFARMMSGSLGAIIAVCVLAPVLEEMLFRGIMLRSFLSQYPRWQAIFTSALIFGIAHFNIYQFVLATWLGIFLGWLYERTKSLIPGIVLHAVINVLAVSGFPAEQQQVVTFEAIYWTLAVFSALVGAVFLRRVLKTSQTGS